MINLNYQSFGTEGFNLRLRFYCNGETKYLAINRKLKGNLYKRHWNQKKQCFIPSAPYSEENNRILREIIEPYQQCADEWRGELKAFIEQFNKRKRRKFMPKKPVASVGIPCTLKEMFEYEIRFQKTKVREDRTLKGTYETYEKVCKRMCEFCSSKHADFEKVRLRDVDANFINCFFEWMESRRGNGKFVYISSCIKAILNKAARNGWYDANLMCGAMWRRKGMSTHKYETLTKDQCRRFINMGIDELPSPNAKYTELFRDFCVFILFTCQSPCDAICLKYENVINGNIIFKRRKIAERQYRPCVVPVNHILQGLLDKYRGVNEDGYIFPIRTARKIAMSRTNNGDIKTFISYCNMWLAEVGKLLGCEFKLHLYTFRHTGITNYISTGADYLTISDLAGTDPDNLKNTYYNCLQDDLNRNKLLSVVNL